MNVFYRNDDLWIMTSDKLSPSVNRMYKACARADKNGTPKGVMYASKEATAWKKTYGELIRLSAGKRTLEPPYFGCAAFFVFENYDTDNRLKILNDALQGSVIVNDKKIVVSSQFKVTVSKKQDLGFAYVVGRAEKAEEERGRMLAFILGITDGRGNVLPELSGKVRLEAEVWAAGSGAALKLRS